MSEIKVNSIKGVGASAAAITVNNTDGTCTANLSNRQNRNLIINGAMQVAQRGNVSSVTSGYGGADRFMFNRSGAAVVTIRQQGVGNSPTDQGFGFSQQFDVTTADSSLAAGDYARISYRFEGQDLQVLKKGTANAEQLTLSFFVKSPKTGTHIVELVDQTNSRHVNLSYTVSSANTYEKKTITFPADTTGTLTNDNGRRMDLNWYLAAGSTYSSGTLQTSWGSDTNANRAVGQVNCVDSTDNAFFLTGVQLEVGSVATDFEHRSIAEELTLCQRYFFKWESNQSYSVMGTGIMTSSTNVDFTFSLPQTMRASPSFSSSGSFRIVGYENNTQNAQALSSFSMTRSHPLTPYLRGVISGGTGGAVGEFGDNGSNNATASFSAEL